MATGVTAESPDASATTPLMAAHTATQRCMPSGTGDITMSAGTTTTGPGITGPDTPAPDPGGPPDPSGPPHTSPPSTGTADTPSAEPAARLDRRRAGLRPLRP